MGTETENWYGSSKIWTILRQKVDEIIKVERIFRENLKMLEEYEQKPTWNLYIIHDKNLKFS